MKRILCILSSLNAGGAETFLMKIYRSLPKNEYQFDFVVSVGDGCYTQEVLDLGGKIYQIPQRTKDIIGAFCGIKSIVRDNKYDTVLKLGENSLAVMDMIAAKLGGAKILAVRSCNAPTGLSFKSHLIHALFKPILNCIVNVKLAPSRLAAEFMFGKYAKVNLLNNGVDLNFFCFHPDAREEIRKEFNINNELVVGHIGRFHEQKNHRYLLEIFKEIHSKREDSVLLLVGTGKLEQSVRSYAEELGIGEHIIFAGQRFDIPQILSAMDVFVFPSFYEGMPNTVIEAQATGLHCVIADTITREANITGFVQYLSLNDSASKWADVALEAADLSRIYAIDDFRSYGYDIESVSKKLISLLNADQH